MEMQKQNKLLVSLQKSFPSGKWHLWQENVQRNDAFCIAVYFVVHSRQTYTIMLTWSCSWDTGDKEYL
jgi:hypothetical protein